MTSMARAKSAAAPKANRRGSPEAIQKRVAARNLNDVLTGKKAGLPALDGRTEKRRQRLIAELSEGELKPVDVLLKVQELLDIGETVTSLRKVVPVRRVRKAPPGAAEALARMVEAYELSEAAYRFLGLPEEVLIAAGVVEGAVAKKRTPKKKAAR
jgi:hypothetical protein